MDLIERSRLNNNENEITIFILYFTFKLSDLYKLSYLYFYPPGIVFRYRDSQLQVDENYTYF